MKVSEEDFNSINSLVSEGYIRKAEHPELPLTIYNYTPQTQFERYWTPQTRICRGLVLDDDRNIVIKCVEKFFNLGEELASPVDLTTARISEKLDGYLIQIKVDSDWGLIVTSRGSFNNKYTEASKKFLDNWTILRLKTDYTYLCELCQNFPEDEGVIATEHPISKLVCWAIKDPDFNEEIPDEDCPLPIAQELSLAEAKEYLKQKVEGVVAQDLNTKERIKIKTDYFVKLHALISDCTMKRMYETLKAGQDITDLNIPDELYSKMNSYKTKLLNQYNTRLDYYKRLHNTTLGLSDKEIALDTNISELEKNRLYAIRNNKTGKKSIENLVWEEVGNMI